MKRQVKKQTETKWDELIDYFEREKNVSRDVVYEAIKASLAKVLIRVYQLSPLTPITVENRTDLGDFFIWCDKEVVKEVEDPATQLSLEQALRNFPDAQVGESIHFELASKDFSRIEAQKAKGDIINELKKKERQADFEYFNELRDTVITGVVARFTENAVCFTVGQRTEAYLDEKEQVKGERFAKGQRIKLYIYDVKDNEKGPRVMISRNRTELVKQLFESEVTELRDGTVEIRSISREAGSRTKMAVYSDNMNIDPVGACVGMNGQRVSSVVEELNGEKIDIVEYNENPGNFIENALAPARIIAVFADSEERTAKIVVPDNQLSLAIGREGQNARLAAKLTGYKIDIKNETVAKETPGFRYEDYMGDEEEYEEEYEEEFDEGYEGEFDEEASPEA